MGGFEDRKNSSAGAASPDTCRTRSDNHDNHETSTKFPGILMVVRATHSFQHQVEHMGRHMKMCGIT